MNDPARLHERSWQRSPGGLSSWCRCHSSAGRSSGKSIAGASFFPLADWPAVLAWPRHLRYPLFMKIGLALAIILSAVGGPDKISTEAPNAARKVYILPIREDIMPPLVYLVRRGVKEAMEAKADLLVLDMETHGGRVDVTE